MKITTVCGVATQHAANPRIARLNVINSRNAVQLFVVLLAGPPVRSKGSSSRTRHELIPEASSCNILLQRVLDEDPLLQTGLCQTESQNHPYHGTAYPDGRSLLNLARAGESDGAPFRTVCVRDDASEPTRMYLWRVLKGALSLSPADSNE